MHAFFPKHRASLASPRHRTDTRTHGHARRHAGHARGRTPRAERLSAAPARPGRDQEPRGARGKTAHPWSMVYSLVALGLYFVSIASEQSIGRGLDLERRGQRRTFFSTSKSTTFNAAPCSLAQSELLHDRCHTMACHGEHAPALARSPWQAHSSSASLANVARTLPQPSVNIRRCSALRLSISARAWSSRAARSVSVRRAFIVTRRRQM